MESEGYRDQALWSEAGRQWLDAAKATAPLHWRPDEGGRWYAVGINRPSDLPPDEPVCGVCQREATPFAAWVAALGGAILQHEYQWEVAARSGLIEHIGKVWEWCANSFHPYPEFAPFPDATVSQPFFGGDQISLRGAGLRTQHCLRRASLRNWSAAHALDGFAGIRLVLPPG
jgi:iron(II)-dependent oxidoreductase